MPSRAPKKVLSVVTMLTPVERIRVDAAGEGTYRTVHRDSVAELVHDIRTSRVGAVQSGIYDLENEMEQGKP